MKKVFIIGIAGTLMSGAAIALKREGYIVLGSDKNIYPPASDVLKNENIKVLTPYNEKNIPFDVDLVIVGNVVSKGHEEMEYVLKNNIPYISFPQFLEENYLPNHDSVVISGTHGKTTTSSLLSWIFESYGLNPSFLIGGIHRNFNTSIRITEKNTPFVIEGDEYDTAYYDKVPKFYHYLPNIAVITSIDFDHADIYPNLNAIREVFKNLVKKISKDGLLIYCDEIDNFDEILDSRNINTISYGFKENSDIRCINYKTINNKLSIDIKIKDEVYNFKLNFSGRHNILNFMACIASLSYFNDNFSKIQNALDSFILPKRRQEIIYDKNDIIVIDDFAHHPKAIKETTEAIKMKYPNKRLIALFEASSNTSRQNIFKEQYLDSFDLVDLLYLRETKEHRLIASENLLNTSILAKELNKKGVRSFSCKNADEILNLLKNEIKANDIILIMSNSSFDSIYTKILKIL